MPAFKNVFTAAAVLFSLASAETIKVTAGDGSFDPKEVTARDGDVIEFVFGSGNHSVVAGSYDYPCSPVERFSGFYSGFVDGGDDKNVFRVTINNTDPLPFYSSQGTDCADGMVGIINANDDEKLDDYEERASELSSGVSPNRDSFGGELVSSSDSDKGDDKDDGDDSNDNSNDDDDSAAGSLGVSLMGVLGAVAIGFAMA